MKISKVLCLFLCLMLLTGVFAACGAQESGIQYDAAERVEAPGEGGLADANGNSQLTQADNRKLIRTVNMEAETEQLNQIMQALDDRLNALGGYYQQRNVYNGTRDANYNRYARLILRVPVAQMDQLVDQVSEMTNVTSVNENTKDITLSYVATQSRMTALQTEETRLLELLAAAKNMEEILQIEERLTDVRTELEEVTTQLLVYDDLVDYATVELYIREVKILTVVQEEEPGFWQRIGSGIWNSLKNLWIFFKELTVFLITKLPYFVLIGALVFLAVKLAGRRKRKQNRQPNSQNQSDTSKQGEQLPEKE